MIFWWVCTECDAVDGVIVISSSDSEDDDRQQQQLDEDPFLFPGDREQHQNVMDDDDEDQVDPPEDLDYAEGRVIQQRFMYGLIPNLKNQQIIKEILLGTYIFFHIHCTLSGCHVVAHTECAHIHLEKRFDILG